MKTTTKPSSKSSTAASKTAAVKAPTVKAVEPKVAAVKKVSAPKAPKKSSNAPVSHGVGRRKSSVARVWLRTGKGAFTVNGKEVLSYFDTEVSRASALAPWTYLPHLSKEYDIEVNVNGGGMNSQADAVKLGVARAVIEVRDDARDVLRSEGLLTVDSRIKERKKYGQRGARRKFQFVKR
jgi:small subunit ribosomal protein S9